MRTVRRKVNTWERYLDHYLPRAYNGARRGMILRPYSRFKITAPLGMVLTGINRTHKEEQRLLRRRLRRKLFES